MPGETKTDSYSPDEADMLAKWENRVSFPDDIQEEADRWSDLRSYVRKDAMLLDTEDAVGTNYIFRNQQALLALAAPADPAPRLLPRRWLPDPNGGAATYPEELLQYARTSEAVVAFQAEQSDLDRIVRGAAQDAMTLPIAWLKVIMQEDFTLDPVGYARNNDQVDLYKRYERLRRDYDSGLFDDQSANYAEMRKASDTIRAALADQMQSELAMVEQQVLDGAGMPVLDEDGSAVMEGGEDIRARVESLMADPEQLVEASDLPEIAHYIGWTVQQIDPEDLRWDWNIRRIEDLRYCRWMAHRCWMTPADIREKWSWSEEDIASARRLLNNYGSEQNERGHAGKSHNDAEYGGKDPEEREPGFRATGDDTNRRGDTHAVWEVWDRVQGRVFRWIEGCGRMLDSFVPDAAPSRFYPFFPVCFSRATGALFGPSDTDLQQPLQDEVNRLRTQLHEAQQASLPRFLIARGLLRPSEKVRLESALPYSVTEAERAEDIQKSIFPLIPQGLNPAAFDRSPALMELQQMAGIPASALGAGIAGNTATSEAITNEQMGNQVGTRRKLLEELYRDIYMAMMEVNAQVLTTEHATAIAGPGAFWPEIDRQQILAGFVLQVEATLDDAQERSRELKAWLDFSQITAQMGLPVNPIAIAKKLMDLMGLRDNLGNYISVPALMQGVGAVPGAAGAQGGAATGSAPAAQGDYGAAGGAPAGEGMSAVPSPESIPNSPA